jgi:protein YIPF5/7
VVGLSELGINFEHIKTMNVLHPLKEMDEQVINDSDMAGPLCFCLGMGATLLLVRYHVHIW